MSFVPEAERAYGEVRSPHRERKRHYQVVVLAVARWLLSGLRGLLLLMPKADVRDDPADYRS